MTTDSEKIQKQKEQDELIKREILRERKFSIAEAIGREGGSFIKGHSPIPRLDQVISHLTVFIRNNGMKAKYGIKKANMKLVEDEGTVEEVLERFIKHERFMGNL